MEALCVVLTVYYYILFARVLLSWFPRVPPAVAPLAEIVFTLTQPIISFTRPLIPPLRIGNISLDLSILLVFIALNLLRAAICF